MSSEDQGKPGQVYSKVQVGGTGERLGREWEADLGWESGKPARTLGSLTGKAKSHIPQGLKQRLGMYLRAEQANRSGFRLNYNVNPV